MVKAKWQIICNEVFPYNRMGQNNLKFSFSGKQYTYLK